jgi:hypothetical protein
MSSQENQSMKNSKTLWRWWAKSIGEKASKCDKESDAIALIRTLIFTTYLITNTFIIAGVIRHWNDKTTIEVYVDRAGIPSYLSETEKERVLQTNGRKFPYD